MCTAAAFRSKDFYFGRTLDYEFSYGDQVVILPRSYPLHYLEQETQSRHYAMIGMACVMEDTPLFYDAVNETELRGQRLLPSPRPGQGKYRPV